MRKTSSLARANKNSVKAPVRDPERNVDDDVLEMMVNDFEPPPSMTLEVYEHILADKLSVLQLSDKDLAYALKFAKGKTSKNLYTMEEAQKSDKWQKLYDARHEEKEEVEIVWEFYTGSGPLYRWTSTEGAKDAGKNGITLQGGGQDGIPTSPSSKRGAAMGSGAISFDYLLIITPSLIPNFQARYTGTRNGPKEIKVLVSIPAAAIQVVSGDNVK